MIQHWFDSNGCIHATGLGKEEEEEEEEEEDEVEVFHGSSSPEVQYWVVDGRGTIVKGFNYQAEACRRYPMSPLMISLVRGRPLTFCVCGD